MRVQDTHGRGLATCAQRPASQQRSRPLPEPSRLPAALQGPHSEISFLILPSPNLCPSPRRRPIQAHLGHCPPTNTQKAVPSQQQGVHLWGWDSGAFRPAAALTSVPLQWPGELTLQMPGGTPGRIPTRAHALGDFYLPPTGF